METGGVTIQEPVFTKTNVGEAPAGVILDQSSMEVHKVNLSTVLDDEITTHDCRNNIIPTEADVVNGSGNKEVEESEREKGEAMKTISVVDDSKIVQGKASETEKDEQGSIFVHEPESSNKNIEDAKIISSDVTLEKKQEEETTGKPEEVSFEKPVIEEDQTETNHSVEQEGDIGNISKACEETPINNDEVKEEKDSRTVNGTEAEHSETVLVEEICSNGDNNVNETVPETETATDGESLHEFKTTERVLLEAEKEEDKEEMKAEEEPRLNALEKVETENVNTIMRDPEIVNNEEITVHESDRLKENAEPVDAIRNSDDAEQTSREVTLIREKEEDITQKTEEVLESPRIIEKPTIQGEDNEHKASLDHEEQEHVLVGDIQQGETFATEAETVDTSTVKEAGILKTNIEETEAVHSAIGGEEEGQETKENTKPSEYLKEDKEQEGTETVKTMVSSAEVRSSDVQAEVVGEHTESCSSGIKDKSHAREESVEVKTKETVQEENTEEKHENLLDVPSAESEKYQGNEPETALVAGTESREKFEEIPSYLVVDKEELKDEKIKVVGQVDGTQIMEEQRGLDSNGVEAEQTDRNRTDETEECSVTKLVALPDVESVEQMQKPSLGDSSKTVNETIKEKAEEEITLHQEGQVEGSSGLETKEETVSVPKSIELEEKSQQERDLTPLQEESSKPNEQEKETKLEKHEPINEEVKSHEVTEVSSTSPSKELEGETVVEAEKLETIKENEDEQAIDKINKSLVAVETVESHSSLPSSSEEQEHGTVSKKIEGEIVKEEEPMVQIKTEDDITKSHERQEESSKAIETNETTVVQAEQKRDIGSSLTENFSMDQSQPEEKFKEACSRDEEKTEISRNSENIVNETFALHSAEAAEEETATNGESQHDVETTKRVLEVEKEEEEAEMMTDAASRLDAIETVKTVVEDTKIVNCEETTAHESKSLKGDNHQEENTEPVEVIKNSDHAEQISREVTVDKETEENISQKTEEVQESSRIIEMPTTQGEDIGTKASLELKEEVDQSSKDTEEHEHVLGKDTPQCETLEAEAVETKEDIKLSLDLKEDKEPKVTETAKTDIFSDEVKPLDQVDVQEKEFGEHTEPCSSEINDASQGKEDSVEVKSKEIVEDESTEEKQENFPDVPSAESENFQDNKLETTLVPKTESQEKSDEIPSDLTLKVDKEELKDDGTQTIVEQRGLNLDEPEAEQIDRNRTEESSVEQVVVVPDVESVEKMEKPTLDQSPLELSDKTSKTIDEKVEDKPKEEDQEEGSYGLEKNDETVSIPESKELGEKSLEENEVKLQKEQIEKHEQSKVEVPSYQQSHVGEISDEVIQVSSASPSEGLEGENVLEAKNIGEQKVYEEEQVADKIQNSYETVETVEAHTSLLSSSEEQEHETVTEKRDDEKVKDAEPMGDMSEKSLEITETTHESLPSVDQKRDIKDFDEEIQIPSVALPLDEQETITSTEKATETEDDHAEKHVDSSAFPMISENNDNETLTAEVKKGDEDITVGTSMTSENKCIEQDELEKLEAPKLEESKEDKSQKSVETIKATEATSDQTLPVETSHVDNTSSSELVLEQDDQTPKQVEEIHEVEATSDRNLPVETSQADNTSSSELVSELDDQTTEKVEEIHEEETKEANNLQAEEILPTEIIPRELSDEALVSMLASREDDQVTVQDAKCADDDREKKDTQEERPVSAQSEESVGETKPKSHEDEILDGHVETQTSPIVLEKNDTETLIAEAKKGDEEINESETTMALDTSCIKQEDFGNHEAPKLEESKEEKSQDIPETSKAIDAMDYQTLPIETSQVNQTLSSESVSRLDDQTPRQVDETHEVKEERKFEATMQNPSSDLASGLYDQTPKQVEEVREEETKEEHKLQVAVDKILPVESSQTDQTPSLVSEQDDQIPMKVEEILEEETKETDKLQAEESLYTETVPRESFNEAPVSMLASGEDEPVTPQEGKCAGDTQEDGHVSAKIEEKAGETKPKEPEAEGTEKSDEVENAKKTDIEVAELTNDNPDYHTAEAEHEDESSSTLPVVGILIGLQTTLETERAINDSTSSGENLVKVPADQEQKKDDAEVESNEKDCASDFIVANRLQQDESRETEKIQEENGQAEKSLPIEEVNLQEEHKEDVKSRDFEVNVEEKLQEENREIAESKEEIVADQSLTEVLPGEKIMIPSSPLPSEELGHVTSTEKQEECEPQEDVNASISEKIQEVHSRDFETSKDQKEGTHETVKQEDQIVDLKEKTKNEEVQDEKIMGLSATRDIEETFSSEVKEGKEDVSELGVGHDVATPEVEKVEEPHSVLSNKEEINEEVTSEKQITDPVEVITKTSDVEQESNKEHIETQAISDDTKINDDCNIPTEQAPKDQRDEQIQVPSSTVLDDFQENSNPVATTDLAGQNLSVQKPRELIQSHQSPNQVEETSFEVKKAQEDKKEETVDALITNENVQVQDQPKDTETPAEDKETSEQEQKLNVLTDAQKDISTNVKVEVRDDEIRSDGHDSAVAPKEDTTRFTEEKREVEHVKTELEDANKHGGSVEEKNNMSEKIDREAAKEINQEETKQTSTVKEEIKEEEKETNQECFNNVKNTDDAIGKTQHETRDIESLSSVSKTQDESEQKDEVPSHQERKIADEVPKLENPKIAEEIQQKDRESENTKYLLSEVQESEPTEKEPARKSLSDLIQKMKGTNKTEDATKEPHIEEEPKTVEEDENENGDHEHDKDDKTSPDSLVMVEAKDTVSIIKTHKKSQGILSGVGSKVKHSIIKVKKVLTGKSSHTTKPSSPK